MLKIGLTGGIGSGKSTVSNLFREHGVEIIDADEIAKKITEPSQPAFEAIVKHFGQSILNDQGWLDRKKLKELIFSNSIEKKWLEELLHPLILNQMKILSSKATSPYCLLVIPLLQEVPKSQSLVDRILVVDASLETQLQRIQKRDSLNETEAKKILDAQASQEERLKIADDIIVNDAGKTKLQARVDRLHVLYLKLSEGS